MSTQSKIKIKQTLLMLSMMFFEQFVKDYFLFSTKHLDDYEIVLNILVLLTSF